MAPLPTTYFLVPEWKNEDFSAEIELGNIIWNVKAPHESIYVPTKADPILELKAPSKQKLVTNHKRTIGDEKKTKIGLFTKLLDILGVAVNASHSKSGSDSETYAVDKMFLKTFRPTDEFLQAVVKPEVVQTHLTVGEAPCAFLVTGTIMAEGITYKAKVTTEKEDEGNLGINAYGVKVGPEGSHSKKGVREEEFTDPGPTMLAFRVQKIQLGADKKPEMSPYDGEFYGEDDEAELEPKEIVFDAELNARDKAGMRIIETQLDVANDDDKVEEIPYLLVPNNRLK